MNRQPRYDEVWSEFDKIVRRDKAKRRARRNAADQYKGCGIVIDAGLDDEPTHCLLCATCDVGGCAECKQS